jgi:hypothetical protein
MKFRDLTGEKFNRLTVVCRTKQPSYLKPKCEAYWLCKCECGSNKQIIKSSYQLTSGESKSCGCLKSELISKQHKKYNTYNLTGDYGVGYTTKNDEFYFDLDDYDMIKDYCWHVDDQTNYVVNKIHNSNGKAKYIYMHRLLTNCENDLVVDHLNHKRNDNRKNNLVKMTAHQNAMNQRFTRRSNTSGVVGVLWSERNKRWDSYIGYQYKKIHLGSYKTYDEAVKARKDGELKYFGKYRYNNYE